MRWKCSLLSKVDSIFIKMVVSLLCYTFAESYIYNKNIWWLRLCSFYCSSYLPANSITFGWRMWEAWENSLRCSTALLDRWTITNIPQPACTSLSTNICKAGKRNSNSQSAHSQKNTKMIQRWNWKVWMYWQNLLLFTIRVIWLRLKLKNSNKH
jgi:hypothetical protein